MTFSNVDFESSIISLKSLYNSSPFFPPSTYASLFQQSYGLDVRTTLLSAIFQLGNAYVFPPNTCILAISIMERYIAIEDLALEDLQLVATSSFFIAAKVDEFSSCYKCSIPDLVKLAGNSFSPSNVLQTEANILRVLEYKVNYSIASLVELLVAAVYSSSVQSTVHVYSESIIEPFEEFQDVALFIVEIALYDLSTLSVDPFLLASAAIITTSAVKANSIITETVCRNTVSLLSSLCEVSLDVIELYRMETLLIELYEKQMAPVEEEVVQKVTSVDEIGKEEVSVIEDEKVEKKVSECSIM
ncbi:hypothetical protein RCL1_007563 [Eukaryota sp. TZLM3-RCL]